jgi:hypothetical protein
MVFDTPHGLKAQRLYGLFCKILFTSNRTLPLRLPLRRVYNPQSCHEDDWI